ncbi:hypothetical protein BRD10_04370 [Halobacteriales archaeon SW_12_71_31]|nr:MAG: hypothetical protein BRD10_04370 [Halobacteriales archaeon SW_12_71_31]
MSTGRAALDAVLGTLQLALFAVLVLGPLAAGFVVGVGPPTYTAEVVEVVPGEAETTDVETLAYADLDADSRAAVDDLLGAGNDRLQRQTDAPPAVLDPGERVVQRDGYAVRVTVERSTPLRPPAVLAGLLGSSLTLLLGAAVVERDLLR